MEQNSRPPAAGFKGFSNWAVLLQVFGLLFLLMTRPAMAQSSVAPTLQIASSNGVSTVFWPLTAYEDILQTKTDLSPAGTWTNLAAADQIIIASGTLPGSSGYISYASQVIGNQIAFSLPATNGQQFFRLSTPQFIPACDFAIFYNGTLEFSDCATMVINGRVHANGPIFVGTTAALTFNAPVTATANLAAPNLNGTSTSDWNPTDPSTWNTTFNGNPGCITNVPSLGILLSDTNNCHFLIDIPTNGQPANSVTNAQTLYDQAQMVLLVTTNASSVITNPTVTLTIQASVYGQVPGYDPAPIVLNYANVTQGFLNANLPFLSLTNKTYDQRETDTNLFTQIDVGKLATWMTAFNSPVQSHLSTVSQYPTILYVADQRALTSAQLPSVRLMNGAQLPYNNGLGFTVATPNPLYVWGNYNVQTSAGISTGVNNTNEVPAALLSDALTILSPNWKDSEGYTRFTSANSTFNAADTTINAAIVTGTMPSTGADTTTFSGGVHNLTRLLENWSKIGANSTGNSLYLNTSIIRLWNSNMATNQWKYQGTYYNPPNRFFSFDQNFLNPYKIPPGIPAVEVMP